MKSKSEAGVARQDLIRDVGVPDHIHSDGAKETMMGKQKQDCSDTGIKLTQTEKNSPWQNRTEIEIHEMKYLMTRTNTLLRLWEFLALYICALRNRIVRPLAKLNRRTPYKIITGNRPDISEFLKFAWYKLIWYYKPSKFPHQNKFLGR